MSIKNIENQIQACQATLNQLSLTSDISIPTQYTWSKEFPPNIKTKKDALDFTSKTNFPIQMEPQIIL